MEHVCVMWQFQKIHILFEIWQQTGYDINAHKNQSQKLVRHCTLQYIEVHYNKHLANMLLIFLSL